MDQLSKLGPFAALSKLWNDLSPSQRVIVTVFVTLAGALVVLIGMVASRPRMSVLFSGLEKEDAGAIVQKLTERKVPYKLSADGGTIEVPASKVYNLRLEMATQGLPQGGSVGFELFDKSNFGMTEFAERLQYQRAIQGELTRTICQLAPVVSARVHLALPEEKLYESEQQPPTASVVLKLRRGTPLTDEQVGGVVHLVASAVEGLKPTNVAVIDSDGNVLSETSVSASTGGQVLTANQTKMKRQYESELAQNLQSMLARIVGADKCVVRVSADMSFDQKQTKSESYEPAVTQASTGAAAGAGSRGVIVSQETRSETYNGSVTPPGGMPSASNRTSSAVGDNYTRSESTAEYQVTKVVEETVSAPGQVSRLSVAVLVDDKVQPTDVAIREAVTAAAGINPTRGDQITVQRMAFDTVSKKKQAAEMASASRMELITGVAKTAGAVVLILVFMLFLRTIVRQIRIQSPVQIAAAPPLASSGYLGEQPARPATAPMPAAPVAAETPERFSTEQQPANGVPPEVAQSSPEDLARLVRNWMSEQ